VELEIEDAIQLQTDLFMALAGALDHHGVLKRDDLATYLGAFAQHKRGKHQEFFYLIAKSCRSSMPPQLRVVKPDDQ
jgi:hypothetical protein